MANRHLMKFLLTLISLVVAQAQSAESENRSTSDYTVVANVQYCTAAGKPLLMDVFVPRQRIRLLTPAVLWLHGGGWERGDKNGSSGARFLASAGFVAASIYYRLSGEATFPADIEDSNARSVIFGQTPGHTELTPAGLELQERRQAGTWPCLWVLRMRRLAWRALEAGRWFQAA